jgi:hypothetical protein
VDPTAGLGAVETRKNLPVSGIELWPVVISTLDEKEKAVY